MAHTTLEMFTVQTPVVPVNIGILTHHIRVVMHLPATTRIPITAEHLAVKQPLDVTRVIPVEDGNSVMFRYVRV